MLLGLLLLVSPAAAQEPPLIGPIAIDLHGSLAPYGDEPQLAAARGLPPDELPSLGLGFQVGAHWYPLRLDVVTFGVGASMFFSRGNWSPPGEDARPGAVAVRTRFSAVSPQLSFNFGSGEGWSYISGGMGWSRFTVTTPLLDDPVGMEEPRAKTINYGGGARWFTRPRMAVGFDLRFYAISPQAAEAGLLERPRMTRMVLSIGAAFR